MSCRGSSARFEATDSLSSCVNGVTAHRRYEQSVERNSDEGVREGQAAREGNLVQREVGARKNQKERPSDRRNDQDPPATDNEPERD
jgi:hypothetical protein